MKKNFTSISIILDRSGSMGSIREATISGFNKFLEGQKNANLGECVVSLHQFDHEYKTDYLCVPIHAVKELTASDFEPRGSTSLLDAIGKTCNELGKRLSLMPESERPDTVIVAIMTDGEENASKEFNIYNINQIISEQTNVYSWEFVFLGANQDAIAAASNLGINSKNAMTYSSTNMGTELAFTSMSDGIAHKRWAKVEAYAAGASISEAHQLSVSIHTFTVADREKQKGT